MQRSGTAFAASFYLKLQRIKPFMLVKPSFKKRLLLTTFSVHDKFHRTLIL
ncbi:hypothetical protein ACW7OE_003976, partial [Acinetobacter baumannii]